MIQSQSKYENFSLGELNDRTYNKVMELIHKPKQHPTDDEMQREHIEGDINTFDATEGDIPEGFIDAKNSPLL